MVFAQIFFLVPSTHSITVNLANRSSLGNYENEVLLIGP